MSLLNLKRIVSEHEVGELGAFFRKRKATALAEEYNTGGPVEYKAVKRGWRYHVVAYQCYLVDPTKAVGSADLDERVKQADERIAADEVATRQRKRRG